LAVDHHRPDFPGLAGNGLSATASGLFFDFDSFGSAVLFQANLAHDYDYRCIGSYAAASPPETGCGGDKR
jgi:hypothetical protein